MLRPKSGPKSPGDLAHKPVPPAPFKKSQPAPAAADEGGTCGAEVAKQHEDAGRPGPTREHGKPYTR